MSIAIYKKVKFDGARCPFSTFLRLQGDHHCACAQKWCHFSFFPRAFKQKKTLITAIKALRPKMTKIASRGGGSCPQHSFMLFCFSLMLLFLASQLNKVSCEVGLKCHQRCLVELVICTETCLFVGRCLRPS